TLSVNATASDTLSARVRDPSQPRLVDVFVNGVLDGQFPLLSLDAINVAGGGGNDTLTITDGTGARGVTANSPAITPQHVGALSALGKAGAAISDGLKGIGDW